MRGSAKRGFQHPGARGRGAESGRARSGTRILLEQVAGRAVEEGEDDNPTTSREKGEVEVLVSSANTYPRISTGRIE